MCVPLCRISGNYFCTKQDLDLHQFEEAYALILCTLAQFLKAVLRPKFIERNTS